MKKSLVVATLGCSILFSGCLPSQTGRILSNPVTTNIEENTIQIKNFAYNPSEIKVKPGTKITISNEDDEAHSIVYDSSEFEPTYIDPKSKSTLNAPISPGTYKFHCDKHLYMTGTIIVQ